MFSKISALKNLIKLKRKNLYQSLLLLSLQAYTPWKHQKTQVYNCIKTETLAQGFSCEFFEIFKNNFLIEYFRSTASVSFNLRNLISRSLVFEKRYLFIVCKMLIKSSHWISPKHDYMNRVKTKVMKIWSLYSKTSFLLIFSGLQMTILVFWNFEIFFSIFNFHISEGSSPHFPLKQPSRVALLQENTLAEVWFLKSHFCIDVLL